jgi:hypothetical protein
MSHKNLFRLIFWCAILAYSGSYLFAGRGVQSLHDVSTTGAFIGGALGLLFGILMMQRARRKHI